MAHEASIRLPARLTNVVRIDPPARMAVSAPIVTPVAASTMQPELAAQREHLDHVLTCLNAAALDLRTQARQQKRALEQASIELAIAIASRFLYAQVKAGAFPFEALVREASARFDVSQPLAVAMHPADLALLQRKVDAERWNALASEFAWISDATLTRGSCRVQAGDRGERFDLGERVSELRQRLLDVAV